MSRPRDSAGFTIIELMLVVTLVAIFAAIALPSFTTTITNSRLQSSNNELASLVQYARSTAVQNNQVTALCLNAGVWSVHKDCSDSNILRSFTPASGVTVSASVTNLTFHSNGTASSTASLISCYGGAASKGYKLELLASGYLRVNSQGKDNGNALSSCTP